MRRVSYILMAAVLASATLMPAARAETGKASLAKAVPTGVYIFVHGMKNPEREFLEKHWAKVWQQLKDTKIDQDLRDLIFSSVPPEEQETIQATCDKWCALASQVDWSGLFGREVVFAGRMMFPTPEYIVLTRPSKESFEKNADALQAMFAELAQLNEKLNLAESAIDGGKMWTLGIAGAPISFHLVQRKDVIGFGFGQGLIHQALGLLSGKPDQKPLVASPRFRDAFDGLPPAEDVRVFFDMAALLDGIDKILAMIPVGPPAGGAPPGETPESQPAQGQSPSEIWQGQLVKMGRAIINELRILDYVASVEYTEGLRTVEVTNSALSPKAKGMALYKAFGGGNEIKKFDEYIPKEATSFSVGGGFDLAALYGALIDFVRKEVPNGEALLAQWEGIQQGMNFNVEKDLLSWLGSKSISVSMPPSTPTMMGGGDWVTMVQVKDAKLGAEKVNEWLTLLNAMLTGVGQPLAITPAEIPGTEGFQTVTHPAAMMFFRPVIGVNGDYLIIASSTGAIETVLATAAGEHPSIMESEGFKRQGLVPTGPVQKVSYKDLSKQWQEIARAMGMVGMFGGFIPADNPGAAPARAIMGMIQKLGPVVGGIDFYESTASVCSFDGRRFRTKSITNYKPYVEPPAAEAATEDKSAAAAPEAEPAGVR